MSTIDVRIDNEEVTKIQFADDCYCKESEECILISSDDSDFFINKEDIPNLIKALRKAKELWG